MRTKTNVFRLDAYLTLHRKPVFPSAKAASFILAEVSSSSILLAFASSRLDFACFFSLMNLLHWLSNLRLLLGELRDAARFLALLVVV